MEKELGPDVIKATQISLGKYVKRPPLSEKLLRKPPFRFLHDIITSVLKTNGFFEGLFEDEELISDNVKDRDSKLLFLNKVITVLALATEKQLSVKSSKIVAGQEPEKTNELLQCLAYALDKKISSDSAVKKYKEDSKSTPASDIKTKEKETGKPIKKTNDVKKSSEKLTSKNSEKLSSNKKDSATVNKNEKSKTSDPKSKRKENSSSKSEQIKKSQNLRTVGKKPSLESITKPLIIEIPIQHVQDSTTSGKEINETEETNADFEVTSIDTTKSKQDATNPASTAEFNTPKIDLDIQEKLNSSYTIAENELNSSLSSQDLMDVENDKIEDKKSNEKSVVESNAIKPQEQLNDSNKTDSPKFKEESDNSKGLKKHRPVLIPKHDSFDTEAKAKELHRNNSQENFVSPTIKRQNHEIVRPPSVRPSSSRPGAPRLREKVDNIIPENDNLILGKVNIITENAQIEEEDDTSVIIVEQHTGTGINSEGQQDTLQFSSNEHGHLVQQILDSQKEFTQVAGKTEIEWQFGAQKAKEALNQEIEQLRFNIQALSRVANPLGKLLDHIQEDVEIMRQELQQWTNVYEEVSKDMLKQKATSEETLVPFQTRVKQLDIDIEEKRDKINDIKILIHKNTTRIEKLLANGNMQ